MSEATRSRADSPTKTCTHDGCGSPLRARGLCIAHYNAAQYSPDKPRHIKPVRACITCGARWSASRVSAKYCTDSCKAYAYLGEKWCVVPDRHPSRSSLVPPEHPSRRPVSKRPVDCGWCGEVTMRRAYCSLDCKRRAKLVRRRGREADGRTYSWSHVMRVLLLLDGCCAYCNQQLDGPPDPDHVVPLSRGGSNGNGNILPSCRACNSDKRDLLLHEWAEDRAHRRKPPVRTRLDRSLPAFAHLLPDAIATGAHAA